MFANIRISLKGLLVEFRRNCAGTIAPIFALAMLPVMTAVGAAVDYSSANKIRSSMQVALDTAMLAGQKMARQTGPARSRRIQRQSSEANENWNFVRRRLFAKLRLGLSRSCLGIRADVISWSGSHCLFACRCDNDCGSK
jgi:hypothetical protein